MAESQYAVCVCSHMHVTEINYTSRAPGEHEAHSMQGRGDEMRRGASRSLAEHRMHNLGVENNGPDMANRRAGILWRWESLLGATPPG